MNEKQYVNLCAQQVVLAAQIQSLAMLVLPLLPKVGEEDQLGAFLRLTEESCERLSLGIGDTQPELSDKIQSTIAEMKADAKRRFP